MNPDSLVIKFACAHCGQKLSVDAAGAGSAAPCPSCAQPLVIPHVAGLHDRGYGGRGEIGTERGGGAAAAEINRAEEVRNLRDAVEEAQQRAEEQARAHAETEKNLAATKLALAAAEKARNTFNGQCLILREEIEKLRSDLREGHAGRELLALRDRFETLTAEQQKTAATLARREAEALALATAEQQTRTDLASARERSAAAEYRADAASETALQRDNDILRGIVARQNAEREEHMKELRKWQRARVTLRIIYGLFALGLIVVVALVVIFLPNLKHLLHGFVR